MTTDSSFCMLVEENVDWTHLGQDTAKWLAVNMVMNGDKILTFHNLIKI
jgi:hypothetical protein